MRFPERLKAIIKYIPPETRVADIGTDHGFIPIYLIENKIAKHVIATDLNCDSLNKAINNIKNKNLEMFINTRLGDGLKVLTPGEVEVAIIAGIGGLLIIKILTEGKEIAQSIKKFIFQPMRDADKLRRYLVQNGYKISDEDLVKERGKFYEIIIAEHGRQKIENDVYYEIGPKLIEKNHPLLKEFLLYKIQKIRRILSKIPPGDPKRKGLEEKIKKLEVLGDGSEMPNDSFHNG